MHVCVHVHHVHVMPLHDASNMSFGRRHDMCASLSRRTWDKTGA